MRLTTKKMESLKEMQHLQIPTTQLKCIKGGDREELAHEKLEVVLTS